MCEICSLIWELSYFFMKFSVDISLVYKIMFTVEPLLILRTPSLK